MIPTIHSGTNIKQIGSFADIINCSMHASADGNLETLTLSCPVTNFNVANVIPKNIVRTSGARWEDADRLYVITKVSENNSILTATAEELVKFTMRHMIVNQSMNQGYSDNLHLDNAVDALISYSDTYYHLYSVGSDTADYDRSDFVYTGGIVTLMDLVAGKEGSLCDRFKKQLEVHTGKSGDQYAGQIQLSNLVVNRNTHLTYGEEIQNYTYETDISGLTSYVLPYWTYEHDDTGEKDFYTGTQQVSNSAKSGFFMHLFSPYDATQDFAQRPTAAQMGKRAGTYLTDHNSPDVRLSITLAKTNKDVQLHEILNIWLPGRTTAIQAKVTDYEYNVLTERYTNISVGAPRKSFARALSNDIQGSMRYTE